MSLNDFVVDALERDRQYKGEKFWTVDNHEKYSTLDGEDTRQPADHRINRQIFMLMCALNDQRQRRTPLLGSVRQRLAEFGDPGPVEPARGPEPRK